MDSKGNITERKIHPYGLYTYYGSNYFIGKCVDQSHDGKGIVKYEGFTYFVNGMITGEVGQIKCIKMLKNYDVKIFRRNTL